MVKGHGVGSNGNRSRLKALEFLLSVGADPNAIPDESLGDRPGPGVPGLGPRHYFCDHGILSEMGRDGLILKLTESTCIGIISKTLDPPKCQ